MTVAPPLREGEEILHNHIPSLGVFKRAALLLLGLTLPVVLAFSVVFPDTYWPSVPLFIACLLLMQERVTLGRHRAWVTNERLILQGGNEIDMNLVTDAVARRNNVRVVYGTDGKTVRLQYAADSAALAQIIKSTGQGAA